jgi:hypothetical protein
LIIVKLADMAKGKSSIDGEEAEGRHAGTSRLGRTVKLRREFIHVNNLADSGVFLDAPQGRRGVSSKSLSRRGSDD